MGVIGLTGGIACGKTLVSDYLSKYGVDVIDADLICRRLYAPGSELLGKIEETFGSEFFMADGGLNRRALREYVFAEKSRKETLDRLVHPAIRKAVSDDLFGSDCDHQLLVVPLLIETGYTDLCDEIWVMYVKEDKQIERLVARDGIEESLAKAMIESQMPFCEKEKYAHRIINNCGTPKNTLKQVRKYFLKFMKNNY